MSSLLIIIFVLILLVIFWLILKRSEAGPRLTDEELAKLPYENRREMNREHFRKEATSVLRIYARQYRDAIARLESPQNDEPPASPETRQAMYDGYEDTKRELERRGERFL